MTNVKIISVTIFLVAFLAQNVAAQQEIQQPKGQLQFEDQAQIQNELQPQPQPRLIIVEIAKMQIDLMISVVKYTVETQIKILNDMRLTVKKITETAITTAIAAIDEIIDATIGTARHIFQDAIDKGINITECYVLNMDKLNILRRKLILGEIQCATSQLGEFYEIVDNAVTNFTDDLLKALGFPVRLQKCLINPLTVVPCVSGVVSDSLQLQKDIPAQILGTMVDIVQYFNEFDTRVHKCQFDQIRKAVVGTREIIDNILECTRHPENGSDPMPVPM